jgi:RNA polymerase sigma factor (sigma-70 family)
MTDQEKWEAAQLAFHGKIRTFARGAVNQLPGLDLDDVIQELNIVLWTCTVHYDPDRGAKFNTYFQGSAKNRIISLIRHANTKSRKAIVTSLDVEAVAAAVDALFSVADTEDRALMRVDIAERLQRRSA